MNEERIDAISGRNVCKIKYILARFCAVNEILCSFWEFNLISCTLMIHIMLCLWELCSKTLGLLFSIFGVL